MAAEWRSWQDADVAARRKQRTSKKALADETLEKNALSYLNRFDSSVANLRKVLKRHIRRHARDADPELVEKAELCAEGIIERYQGSGLLDDRRYASTMAWSLRERGSSARAIEHKLAARGVEASAIRDAISDVDKDCDEDAELVSARRFARRRRIGPHRAPAERNAKRERDLGALARAGFSLDVARRVLDEELT